MQRISVVIPSYNHEAFIADAIRSVAAQEVDDLELVIVDDGSTDASVEVIEQELERSELDRVVFHRQTNRGAHAAIMRGIEASSGDVIAILNSDDRFAPARFERMEPHFRGRGEFLAFSMVRVIGASGAELPESHPTSSGYRHALYEATRCPTVGFGLLRNNFAVTSGNFVFTRSLYEKLGGFSQHRLAHDWDFVLRSLVHVEPIFVPERLIDYRYHATNTIHEVGDLGEEEGSEILNRFLSLAAVGTTNPLAPCPRNWPLYFDLFVSRYAPWFGGPSIRSWIRDAIAVEGGSVGRPDWHSWAEAVDFEPVEDCGYIVDPGPDPGTLDAMALAREVLVSEAHPLAVETGDGEDALRALFERRAHPLAPVQCTAWTSPLATAVDPDVLGEVGAKPPAGIPGLSRRLRSAVGRSLEGLGLRPAGEVPREILRSGLFDAEYYLAAGQVTGVRPSRALRHFLDVGAGEGLDPHPLFDTSYYFETSPDVARSDMNPLMHYLAHGAAEGRDPMPLFSSRFYLASNADVAASGMNPLAHYVLHGAREGRTPHPRFDAEYYREHSPVPIGPDVSPLAHYVIYGASRGLPISRTDAFGARLQPDLVEEPAERRAKERGPLRDSLRRLRFSGLFDPDFYSQHIYSHSEVVDPFRHFIEIGSLEGLPFAPADSIAARVKRMKIQGANHDVFSYLQDGAAASGHQDTSVDLFVSRLGNAHYRELADVIAHGLERAGARCRVLDETKESDGTAGRTLVFGPHEFFTLGDGPARFREGLVDGAHLVMAEPPGSVYFSIGLWFAQRARGVLDVNPAAAYLWAELGFAARFLPLGAGTDAVEVGAECRQALLDGALGRHASGPVQQRDAESAARPIDVLFDGETSPRLRDFFARQAPLFSSLRCALFMPAPDLEPTSALQSALRACEAAVLGRSSKICLALKRDDVPHVDWMRVVQRGMGNGAIAVVEEGLELPGFVAGKHYIETPLQRLPAELHRLVATPDGRAEADGVRRRALHRLDTRFAAEEVLGRFLIEQAEQDQGRSAGGNAK